MSKIRKAVFEYFKIEHKGGLWLPCKCRTCKGAIFNPAIVPWEAAHMVARAHGGSDDPPNVVPMQRDCHRHETETIDVPRIAKGKRTADKLHGIKRKSGWRSAPNAPPGMRYNKWARRYEPAD